MPTRLGDAAFKLSQFDGGLNLRDPINLLASNDLIRCENVAYDGKGGLGKRMGTLVVGAFGSNVDERGISCYTLYLDPPDVPQIIVHTNLGNLRYSNDFGVTWGTITTGLSTTVPCSFETSNSLLFFCEGTRYASWDGLVYTDRTSGAPAQIRYLRLWQDTMWASGGLDLADRVYAATPADPTTWPALSFVDILHGDDDRVSGLFTDGQFLCVGKLRRLSVIVDPVLFTNRIADYEKGLESHFSVVHLGEKLYYLSRLGICEWMGDSSSRIISYKVDRLFRPDVLNYVNMDKAYAYTIDDRCGWILPEDGSTSPTLVIEYYPYYGPLYQISGRLGPGPWVIHRIPVLCFCTVRGALDDDFPHNTETLLGPSSTKPSLMQVFAPVGTDDGQAFTSVVETATFDFGDAVNNKYLRRMKLVGRGVFYVQLKRDYKRAVLSTQIVDFTSGNDPHWGDGLWGDAPWGPSESIREKIINWDAYGRVFSVCITDSRTDAGHETVRVGAHNLSVPAGTWGFYEASVEATRLGLRGSR